MAVTKTRGDVVMVVKSADETVNNSDTLQADDELNKYLGDGVHTYLVEVFLKVTAPSATSDFKADLVCTGATLAGITSEAFAGAATGSSPSALDTAVAVTRGSINGTFGVGITALVTTAAAPATLQLRWAQNTATAENTVVKAGSCMRITRLD